MQLRQRFRLLLGIQFALATGLAILTATLVWNQAALSRAQQVHFRSYLLADELRQSSDDLTRLVRTFVATGEEKFERTYWAVLDIRNGKRPRPVDYHRIYWDLVTTGEQKPRPDGPAVSLPELMVREGFTEAELAKLASAQRFSDALVQTERIAVNAAKGRFDDGTGRFTVQRAPDRALAMRMLNDAAYHENKARIMQPIDDFYVMFARRTAGEVFKFEQRSLALLAAMGAIIAAILGLFVYSFLTLRRQMAERERAEAALRASEERYRLLNGELEQRVLLRTGELAASNREIQALLDSIPDTVLLFERGGAMLSSRSPAGQPGPARAGDRPAGSRHDPVREEIAREIHALAQAGDRTVVREFDRAVDGAPVSIEARATWAGPDRLLVLLRDISDRKRNERDVLAHLQRERQLSEMKSQFITVASHEFRTPLAAAVGSTELLERHAGRLPEAKRGELLARIQQALGRLTAIMDDMLMLSRADSGRVKAARMEVDLARFVADVVQNAGTSDRQQHAFSFRQTRGPRVVATDTNLLHHILSKLIENAVLYSPAGTPVAVELEVGEEAFRLTVTDEGIGIPATEHERIFEPFVRGSNVDQIGGTGLGLNLAKRYAELMGGRIELLPTSRGASFRVSVPLP